jgi:TadE-like protein
MHSTWKPGHAPKQAARPHERGQALVEFALIAPLFLVIVVGIIQFGIGLNYWLDLNRIANQGARWAAVDKYPNCNGVPTSPGCVTPTLVSYLESEPVSGGLQPTARVCFERPTGVLATTPLPAASSQVGQPVSAEVATKFTFLPILDMFEVTLRGKATMRIEQVPVVLRSQSVGWCP